jgi:hypothetical protein
VSDKPFSILAAGMAVVGHCRLALMRFGFVASRLLVPSAASGHLPADDAGEPQFPYREVPLKNPFVLKTGFVLNNRVRAQ